MLQQVTINVNINNDGSKMSVYVNVHFIYWEIGEFSG